MDSGTGAVWDLWQLVQRSCSEGGSGFGSLPSCELQAVHPAPSVSATSATSGPCRKNRKGSGLGRWGLYGCKPGEKGKAGLLPDPYLPFSLLPLQPFWSPLEIPWARRSFGRRVPYGLFLVLGTSSGSHSC